MLDKRVLGLRVNVFTTNELLGEGYHKELSSRTTTGGHSVRAVDVHVVNSDRQNKLWFSIEKTSLLDEQLMSIAEISLSGNTSSHQ